MKKAAFILLFSIFLIHNVKSQADGGVSGLIVLLSQRSTVLYTDTVFEIDQLKFEVSETYAFRNKIKVTITATNLSDNFKILNSEDFTITDSEGNAIVINKKRPIIIAPKTTKKIGLLAESKSFKLYDIKISLKQIQTTGNVATVLNPSLFNLRLEGASSSKIGPLEVTSVKCGATENGTVKAYFKLNYTGTNFLAIYGSKAMLLTADKKAYVNIAEKSKLTFYPSDKPSVNIMLEFLNPQGIFSGEYADKVRFENVFMEYTLQSNTTPIDFHVYKKGMTKGEDPKEIKDKEAED